MKMNWQELTRLTDGEPFSVERVRLDRTGIVIEGEFELPGVASLRWEDQIFVMAFVKSHGSIKEMERIFGVSYPTIKARLNRISEAFVGIDVQAVVEDTPFTESPGEGVIGDGKTPTQSILDRLERGEINAEEAALLMKARKN